MSSSPTPPVQARWGSLLRVLHASLHSVQPLSFLWVSPAILWAPENKDHIFSPLTLHPHCWDEFLHIETLSQWTDLVHAPFRSVTARQGRQLMSDYSEFPGIALKILHPRDNSVLGKLRWPVTLQCQLNQFSAPVARAGTKSLNMWPSPNNGLWQIEATSLRDTGRLYHQTQGAVTGCYRNMRVPLVSREDNSVMHLCSDPLSGLDQGETTPETTSLLIPFLCLCCFPFILMWFSWEPLLSTSHVPKSLHQALLQGNPN